MRTLDGTGTFHGMGIIAISSSTTKMSLSVSKTSRSAIMKSSKEVSQGERISVSCYGFGKPPAMKSLTLKPLVELYHPYILSPRLSIDQLRYSAAFCSKLRKPCPNWLGFMQSVTVGPHPSLSKLLCLK